MPGPDTGNVSGESALIRAAQYVRMSTEHQRYSIDNQIASLARYAGLHGMEVVQTYADHGKSGLSLRGREGLLALLSDVRDRRANYDVLLVYDVSRWGRFQDADEGAYYEFLCRRAGIPVIYCAEPFKDDGSALTAIIKSIKRAMAAEYSRELSARVRYGQIRKAQRGFHVGNIPPIGLRRMLVSDAGEPRGVLERGDRKHLSSDSVILVPGPGDEVALVNRIFRLFVISGLNEEGIAKRLNREGLTKGGRPWSRTAINHLLRNEKYIGTNVFNKTTCPLKSAPRPNPEAQWVRVPGAFEPIVGAELFAAAQSALDQRATRLEPERMLDGLRSILKREGRLTGRLITAEPGLPCLRSYADAFGSVYRAYGLVGYTGHYDRGTEGLKRDLREMILQGFAKAGVPIKPFWRSSFRVDDDWWLNLKIARRYERPNGDSWWSRIDLRYEPALTVIALTSSDGKDTEGFLFLPPNVRPKSLYLRVDDPQWDEFRSDDLTPLFDGQWRALASPEKRPRAPRHITWSTRRRERPAL